MKKLISTLVIVFNLILVYSQSSIHLASLNNAGTATISAIPNGGTFTLNTTPSTYDVPSKFRFYNISTTDTNTYNVLRIIKQINTQGVNTATTYFCVGATCLPPNANTLSNPADYIKLSPGASDELISYFSELSTIGYSEVYYKIFNVYNPNDTLSFTMIYNAALSVQENQNILENIHVFPLPARDIINITAKINQPSTLHLSVYNVLGQQVINQSINISEGFLKKTFDVSSLSKGVYFLKISSTTSGNTILTKKLIVE